MDADDLKLRTLPSLVVEIASVLVEVGKLCAVDKKGGANGAVLNSLHEEVLAVTEAVADLLPVAEKAREVRVDAKKRVRSAEVELTFLKNREASFDGTTTSL